MSYNSEIKFEEINCPLCNSPNKKIILSTPDYNFGVNGIFTMVKCLSCSMCYVSPRPVLEDIIKIYPDTYVEFYAKQDIDSFYRNIYIKRLEFVKRIVPKGKLLEIGCAGGYFLTLAKQQGYETMGIEIDERSAKFAHEYYGLNVQRTSIENANLPESYYDIIVMFDVFEHVFNPSLALRKLINSLTREGYLLIKVPNFQCLESRIFGKFWYVRDLPRHLLHFSPITLNTILLMNGFKNIKIIHSPEPDYGILSFIKVIETIVRNEKYFKRKNRIKNLAYKFFFVYKFLCYINKPIVELLAFINQGNSIVSIAQK